MANPEHLKTLRLGVLEWNDWREQHPRVRPDLRDAALPEAALHRYDLRDADLRGASLLAARLDGADLRGADLSGCDLRYCSWSRARLSRAKLNDARGADARMIRAAGRVDWRERLSSLPLGRSAAAVAVLALGWAGVEYGFPEQSALAQSPVVELAVSLGDESSTEWNVEGVAISGGLMRIRLDLDDLSEKAYVETLEASCQALASRALQPPVERIEVLRLDGQAGWLFEPAVRCPQVLGAPPERRGLAVAASSLPIRPKPSPAAARRDDER